LESWLRHPEGEIQSVAFSPDAKTLATGVVRPWNVSNGQQSRLAAPIPADAAQGAAKRILRVFTHSRIAGAKGPFNLPTHMVAEGLAQ
jgi:hypothetical protein